MGVKFPIYRAGIGQDSRRFLTSESSKPCILGGVIFEGVPGLDADSDGDVILNALCNAITSLTHVEILSGIAKDLCRKDGITDSQVYLQRALETLGLQKIVHVALTVEGKRPRFETYLYPIRKRIGEILSIHLEQVGLTVHSGEGLTDFGCGDGLQCLCILTTVEQLE